MDISRDIDSLSNFKHNTVKFLEQMKQTGKPVVLTINGEAELVVQDARSYQALLNRIEHLETVKAIRQGLQDVDAGKTMILEEFEARMRTKYDIHS